MTEEQAEAEVQAIAGAAMPLLKRFADIIVAENAEQNLISKGSVPKIWSRHFLDSIQLALAARPPDSTWIDIGSGGGFPGIVIAAMKRWQVTLVEPRRRRAEFLKRVCDELDLGRTTVIQGTAQGIRGEFDIVSARAVASIGELLEMSAGFRKPSTLFIFPRGQRATADVELARRDWHGLFHVEQSLTNPESGIVLATEVRPR